VLVSDGDAVNFNNTSLLLADVATRLEIAVGFGSGLVFGSVVFSVQEFSTIEIANNEIANSLI